MNDDVIVTTFVVLDELLRHAGHHDHPLAGVSDADVLTVAVVAAAYFQNHHARALPVMQGMHSRSGHLSTARFHRRCHALADGLGLALAILGESFATGEAFIRDSLPLPVCRRVRARRCGTVRGRAYCGDCAAKREPCCGWRLHLVVTPQGVPVAFVLLPAAFHDLPPVHELTVGLPAGASAYGDKAFTSKTDETSILTDTGVRLVPIRKANRRPNLWADKLALRELRPCVETTTSQLAAMGVQRLHARTNLGSEFKVHASLIALTIINAH